LAELRRRETFRNDVLSGLAQHPRAISAQWFYDFRRIKALRDDHRASGVLSDEDGKRPTRGSCPRDRHVDRARACSHRVRIRLIEQDTFVAFGDVALSLCSDRYFWRFSSPVFRRARSDIPGLPIHPVEADFTLPISLPKNIAGIPSLGFFPGSTIGNLSPRAAVDLLRVMADTLRRGMLLIGIDRVKDASILVPAYDDAQGVTARFNLNLLQRINRELAGTIPLDAFRHRACWNEAESRIEMHLLAVRNVRFAVGGNVLSMQAGETIHTENSYKYGPRDAKLLLRAGGWSPVREWTDADAMFGIYLAQEGASAAGP
jgi:L-histidine N-alpha-methyltransferase